MLWFGGQSDVRSVRSPAMTGGGFDAVTVVVEVLSSGVGSASANATVAVLLMDVPSVTGQSTFATSVIVAVPPPGIAAKLTVRLLPAPPQTPPPDAAHDMNAVDGGSRSVTTTEVA